MWLKISEELECAFGLSCWDLPNHNAASCSALGYLLKALNEQGVHGLGFRVFGATMWKLFGYWTIFPMKTKWNRSWKLNTCIGILGGIFAAVVGKPLASHTLNRVLFHKFSELMCERCWFWVYFVARNLNKLQYLGLERKKSVQCSICSHCQI